MENVWKNKNDYSIIVFDSQDNQICKIEFCHNLYKASIWLNNSKYRDWSYFNAYNRRSKSFLKRYYKGQFIPAMPR